MNDLAARAGTLLVWLLPALVLAKAPQAPRVDHHQHLRSAAMTPQGQQPIDAAALVAMLDAAGMRRAVLLSNAFNYGAPRDTPLADEYAQVRAENDWTRAEAARYPKRLVAFCSFNPLRDYALEELARCAGDPRFGRGIKLQFGSSDVDLDDAGQVARLREVFRAANEKHLAVVVHLRPRRARRYGAPQADIFIEQLLAAAPDVTVQIAHFTGGGNPADAAADAALGAFIAAIARKDPRLRNLYFDTALVAPAGTSPQRAAWIAARIREIGVQRILYGSDGGDPTDPPPAQAFEAFRQLPLDPAQLRVIERNVAPYLH